MFGFFKRSKSKENKVLQRDISFGRITLTQKALFAKHLAVMLDAGLVLSEALTIAADASAGKLKKRILKMQQVVIAGNPLSSALAAYPRDFPEFFISAVQVGESSGTLANNLKQISLEMEKERALKEKIQSAMVYPSVIMVAAIGLGGMFSFYILPKLTPLFSGLNIELPFTTRVLISFSNFVVEYGHVFFASLVAGLVLLIWLWRLPLLRSVTHKIILNLPIVGRISMNSNLARFNRTMGLLLKSGVSITESLGIVERTMTNYYYQKAMADIRETVAAGTPLSDGLDRHHKLFPLLVTRMIGVGEQAGNFEETLYYLAEFYEDEVDSSTKALAVSLEPILLACIGLVVGFLALSIITPIYDITGNIRQ